MNKTKYGAQRHNNPEAECPRKNPVHCMRSRGSDSRPRCMRCQILFVQKGGTNKTYCSCVSNRPNPLKSEWHSYAQLGPFSGNQNQPHPQPPRCRLVPMLCYEGQQRKEWPQFGGILEEDLT